jgi:tRNA synthetases class II (A)
VADGVIPGNEGRGYVLRRIARRGIRHGYKLGARKPFFHSLVAPLVAEMGDAYPDLRRQAQRVTDVLKQEEERFFQTIANGMEILERELLPVVRVLRGLARQAHSAIAEMQVTWGTGDHWAFAKLTGGGADRHVVVVDAPRVH